MVLIVKDRVFCANVGDSRSVLYKGDGLPVEISEDHKPSLERERKRVLEAGGRI